MKRVLILQPSLDPPGGGSGVAAWIIEALKRDHRLTLFTWRAPNLAEVNRFFGTSLAGGDFELRLGPRIVPRVLERLPFTLALLKDTYLMRRARRLAPDFDVVISTCDEADLGGTGIQYIHYPRFSSFRPDVDLRALYHRPRLVRAYRAGVLRLWGTSLERMRHNRTLANSDFIADRYRDVHGVAAETVFPPAVGPFPSVPWEEREDGIVCIGRIAPVKRLEHVIDVVERLRARGLGLHLHIIGTADDAGYAALIRSRARARSDWVALEENLPRPALCELVARHRYGIHGMEEEHFGMAVAEMASAGCIVFVPDGGGQREIVGGEQRLLYRSAAEAADKIARVIADPELQRALREALASRAAAFTTEHFTARIRRVVAEFAP